MTVVWAGGIELNGRAASNRWLCCRFALCLLGAMLFGRDAFAQMQECLIEPSHAVEASSAVAGLLESVLVKRGDQVLKGQVVAVVDSRAERAAADLAKFKSEAMGPLKTAESKVEFARRKLQRKDELAKERLIPLQERDDAEGELRQAEAEVIVAREARESARLEYLQLQAQLTLRTIRSPVNGVVTDQLLFSGEAVETVGAKKVVAKIAQVNPLRVRLILPMSQRGQYRMGERVKLVSEVSPARSLLATVSQVDRVIDAASGSLLVYLSLPNPASDIPVGVRCKTQ